MKPTKKLTGFTLIELMIVVVVISVLATVAYPSYTSYVIKGKRAEGKARLLEIMQRQERYFTDNNSYVANVGVLFGMSGVAIYSGSNNNSDSPYVITGAAGSSGSITTSVLLTATPQGGQAADAKCANLTLDSNGTKAYSGTATALKDCW